jgi:hypothetical protein
MKMIRLSLLLTLCTVIAWSSRAQLTVTNLPIVIITTPGAVVDTYTQATMQLIDNASGTNNITDPPTFSGTIGIRNRGNQAYPKKSYSIETWSGFNVSLDTALLGMPSENDWVLLSYYTDRSLMRDLLSKSLHEKMGRYAARGRLCEVVLNNQYIGVYSFAEKIKRTLNRLDLAKLTVTDNFGENMTGGYIWRVNDGASNSWISAFTPPFGTTQQTFFNFEYPDPSDITPSQEAYIESYVDSFETAMNAANFQDTLVGWRKFGAVNGFADFMIINEVSRNIDAYRNNMFMYKDKSKKMRPGPIWAFDDAFANTATCVSSADTGWCFNLGGTCPGENKLASFWWSKLTTDTAFMKDLKCLYTDYRKPGNLLDTAKIWQQIDSIAGLLNAQGAVTRNFTQWPIWGVPIVNEPTPMSANYTEEIAKLKTFIRKRLTWLDGRWILSTGCPAPLAVNNTELQAEISLYPNPVSATLTVEYRGRSPKGIDILVRNMQGQTLMQQSANTVISSIDMSGLPSGIYLVEIKGEKGRVTRKIVRD